MGSDGPLTILVVDDSDHARSFVADALRTAEFDVIEAATGADGLRLAGRGLDLIVLDINLPDIDGRQVCRQIKADPTTASIPVVHISGVFQESLDRARALEGGADAYLPQPVTPEELVATVRTILRAYRAEQESEQRFRLLMDSAPILVSGFDAAGRVVLFNRACEELTGLRRDDALGQSLATTFLPAVWHALLKNGEVAPDLTPTETRWQSATGMERVIESAAFFIPAGDGRRTLVQVGRDITERKRNEGALERRGAQAKAMVEVARAITSSLDLPAVLDLIVDRVAQLLGMPRASIAVIEPETSDAVIRFVAYRGMSANFTQLRPLHWRDGTTPTAIQERRPVWSADLLNDPAFALTPSTRSAVEAEGYRAGLSVPLLASDRPPGALAVYRDAPGPFTDEEVDLLEILAAQAAVAIRNAQLYSEAQRRQREAETVAVLTRAINRSLDLDAVLQAVDATARALCGSDVARIALREPDSGSLVFRYWVGPGPSSWVDARIQPGRGIGGRAFAERRPVRTENYLKDPDISKDYAPLASEDEI